MWKTKKDIIKNVVVIAFVLLIVASVPAFCSWLWNNLMPYLFNLPTINYWQALGLILLSRLLFFSGSSSSKR